MKHKKIKGHQVFSWDDLKEPGDFMFDEGLKSLLYVCPCGGHKEKYDNPRTFASIVRKKDKPNNRQWEWDGNREKPTLSPSIKRLDGCKWHGHLVKGIWIPCDDSGT